MSQLQALQKLYVGGNKLQYSDVEFIIESFPQLTQLAINDLGLTGRFAFRKSRTSCPSSSVLTHLSVLPESIGQLLSLESLDCSWNEIAGTIYFSS
jgi:Leucine-rich repeat (LRR) protein